MHKNTHSKGNNKKNNLNGVFFNYFELIFTIYSILTTSIIWQQPCCFHNSPKHNKPKTFCNSVKLFSYLISNCHDQLTLLGSLNWSFLLLMFCSQPKLWNEHTRQSVRWLVVVGWKGCNGENMIRCSIHLIKPDPRAGCPALAPPWVGRKKENPPWNNKPSQEEAAGNRGQL